ncbi:MAG: GreA/GreB family elongation factor [Pseudomonadota bacterium]
MGRWRAPRPKSAPYITSAGFNALQQELDGLWLRRRDVVQALSAAAAEGDRSENAEYIYRKKELGGIDRRIRYLQKRLPELKVIETPAGGDRVFFGATVTLLRDGEDELQVRIVGADEIDAAKHWISVDSPLASAILGKPVDTDVSLVIDGAQHTYEILELSYAE